MSEVGTCIDCGKEASGLRCKTCHGEYLRQESLRATAASDAELLRLVDQEKLTGRRLADRLEISRPRAAQRVKDARRREGERAQLTA